MSANQNLESYFFKGQHTQLCEQVKLDSLKEDLNINTEKIVPFYYLCRSYERNGLLTQAWDVADLLEKKISKFNKSKENLPLLIFIILKVYLLMKKGMNKEALYYLPVFGEYIEDNQIFPADATKHKFIALYYFTFGNIFQRLGEYDQAFSFYQKSLSLVNNNENLFPFSSEIFTKIGDIFYLKGEAFYANENYKTALKLANISENTYAKNEVMISIAELNIYLENDTEIENIFKKLNVNDNLITDPNQYAKLYFSYFMFQIRNKEESNYNLESYYLSFVEKMSKIENHQIPFVNFILFMAKGIYLHRINSLDNIRKAKEILESTSLYDGIDLKYSMMARKELCEIYFKEVKYLKKEESITKFGILLKELLTQAKRNHLYPLLIELFLLQSNLELYLNDKNNIVNAERYLTLADIISQEKNLKRLTSKIFKEEKRFKQQIERWQSFISANNNLKSVQSLQEDDYFYP